MQLKVVLLVHILALCKSKTPRHLQTDDRPFLSEF